LGNLKKFSIICGRNNDGQGRGIESIWVGPKKGRELKIKRPTHFQTHCKVNDINKNAKIDPDLRVK
jgi:hypothetical protein